ncbi:hypothetical protein ABMA27_011256 [Loxostege sticticalis]|uniref:MBD domain-containing protein n=1 Tax=Loxostege sticticalis TaxID=481309 RepID=A0ABR3H1U3_LOXSC
MSSGQGDSVPAKADDDTEIKSPNEADKLPKDQVDHVSSLDKEVIPVQGLASEDTSNKTDSGFKDHLPSDLTDKTKSNSDNTDDNSDDDLELKWEDEESDEQSFTASEKVQEATGHSSDLTKPMEADIEDTNLSSTEIIDEKAEEIDENKLLESSPSNNEDTNHSSTSDGPKNNLPLKNFGNEAISDDVEDTIYENQLLEGPVSDTVDEDKLLEISDENKEDSLSTDDLIKADSNSTKTDIEDIAEKSKNLASIRHEDSLPSDIASKTLIHKEIPDSQTHDVISVESTKNSNLDSDSTKLVVNKDTTKVISNFQTSSPIQHKSKIILPTSCSNDSLMDTTVDINTEHGLKKPDMMLEIPTQEIIELDDTDVSISGNYHANDDDEMEVDNIKDSSKTAPTVDMDVPMEVRTPSLEERADALILQPVNVFRALDIEMSSKEDSNKANKVEDVSEDDWCAIERRLEGFEDSFNEESQLNKMSKISPEGSQEKDDIPSKNKSSKPNDEKPENTESLPLTEAQKMVIASENKELLRTLQDTSKLDITDDQISTTMDVDDETLLDPDSKDQTSSDTPLESTEPDTTTNTSLQSNLDKTKEVTPPNNEKEIEVTSDSVHKKLETSDDSKTDNDDPNPMSSPKETEKIEVHKEIIEEQIESAKPDTVSTTVLSSHIEEITTEPSDSLKVDESTKENDKIESSEIKVQQTKVVEAIEVQKSTIQCDDEILSSTHQSVEVKSPSKQSVEDKIELETYKPVENKDLTSTPKDKIENQPVKKLTDDNSETSPSKLTIEDEIVPSTTFDIPLTTPKSIDDEKVTTSTAKETEIEEVELPVATKEVQPSTSELLPSTSIPDSEVPLTTSDEKVQPEPLPMEVEPSSNEKPTKSADLPSTEHENEVISTSKTFGIIDDQPSTSSNIVPSTSKKTDVVQPSTSSDKIDVQASTSKVSDDIEVQASTSKVVDDVEVQPSTSKSDVEVKSTMEVPVTSVEPADPDSDEVPETSDSLGLLAESSRVMEDDEDQDDDDDPDVDGDDDDDYDPEDESSNQMTAEHSEDSNAPPSETDLPKDQDGKETEIESPLEEKGEDEFNFVTEEKDGTIREEKVGGMEVDGDIVQDDIEVTTEQIGNEATTDDVEQSETTSATKKSDKEKPKQAVTDIVKLSDASNKEAASASMLKKLLTTDEQKDKTTTSETKSSTSKLGFTQPSNILSIVDLEGSSSEDDIQEITKDTPKESGTLLTIDGYKITIPSSVDVSTVPVDKPPEVAGEKTGGSDEKTEETPAKTDSKPPEDKSKPKFSLEIFNLDSDEEDNATAPAKEQKELPAAEPDKARGPNKCINIACTSTGKTSYYRADAATVAYYDAGKRKKPLVCEVCADTVVKRAELLVKGIKDLTPLLELDTGKMSSELVEISDSESEDEADTSDEPKETLGETGACFLEANLAKMINETWTKFCLDSRLTDAQDDLNKEMEKLEAESKEIDAMLSECQVATDKLRNDLYATFEQRRREVGAIVIYDTPLSKYVRAEEAQDHTAIASSASASAPETRAKRRMSSAAETPAKRPAIPLGYAPLDSDTAQSQTQGTKMSVPTVENTKAEDDKDISVLKVSAEAAPPDLPPPGELVRPPLRAGACVYAMRNSFGCWTRSKVLEVNGKSAVLGMSQTFTVCRVKYEHKPKGSTKLTPARCLAYADPASVRLTIGTRIIALFKDAQNPLKKDAFYSGIIAEVPNPVNNYRYLVFFDDGYAQYVHHRDTRVVCECSSLVWEEVHPFSREFVKEYLMAYPERPMVRLHAGQSLKTEWNGKWWTSRVIQVDASLVQVHFEEDSRTEWIYRGSTRLAPLYLELQAAERHRARPMPRTKAHPRINMPYVEYTRSDENSKSELPATQAPPISEREIRQRAVAKKSTALPPTPNIPAPSTDSVTSRVVYYTPKNAVKPYKMTSHSCGPQCKRKDVLALKDLRTYNPLAKPLLSGWERQIVRYKGHKEVMYRAPCGRRLRNMRELHRYLRLVQSDMAVDLFDFTPHTHCLAEFVLNKCLVGKKDLSHGKENVPVPCVNYYDESLPEFCSYNTERTPTAGVPLNLDPEFLCGCDCTDDCEDKSKCACWQMTLEGARTIGLNAPSVGYKYKRLPEPLPSGIYECNSRCKCKQTCLNRVAQHPLQLKLQVFKTLNRGWGIRALNDVPKGSFLCVYAGNLLTDATANMDGLNEGDEYLAELDYIEVVEQMKEGYEEDIPEADKRLDRKNVGKASEESEMSSSSEEDEPSKNEQEDGDFCPGYIGPGVSEFSKRLRKRDKNKKKKEAAKQKEKDGENTGDDCITISDDEEVREPSSFMAQAGMGKEFISKYKSVRSYFGKDEACYIMDAKVQGNIGRYLNHSCQPNVFVQNVFVDTHDPRFPWVAFFALSHIKAGTELTWNYNYDVGSVPGKVLYCYCGAPNCRGRLL